jgi:CRP-like cAMP-binding protein
MEIKSFPPYSHTQSHGDNKNRHCGHLQGDGAKRNDICVSIVPIFNHLDKEQMLEISAVIQSIQYKKGEFVYCAGDQSDSLYIVREGKIRTYRLSETGKEQLVRILHPGDFTGVMALFNESTYEEYADTMEETHVCTIKRSDFQKLLEKYPVISLKLLAEISNRLEQAEKKITRFATERVEKRIALFFDECIDDKSQNQEFVLPMSKKDLASYLGTTPETISRKIHEFEAAGYIKQKTQKRIEILDRDGLLHV